VSKYKELEKDKGFLHIIDNTEQHCKLLRLTQTGSYQIHYIFQQII